MQIICHGLKNEDFPVEFINGEITLGSEESNSIVVKAEGVSGRHALLTEDGDTLFIKDSGSQSGTFLNHKQVQDKRKVSSGDIIQIGSKQIRVDVFPKQKTVLNFLSNDPKDYSIDATAVTIMPTFDSPQKEQTPPAEEELERTMVTPSEPEPAPGPAKSAPDVLSTTAGNISIEGQEIGKYIIVKRIGKGGMGEVFLAKHKTLGTYRALKVLPKELLEDNSKFLERFIREAKLASEIRHPNVVGVMDVETDSAYGLPYIVMEYIDGGSLRGSLATNKKLSEEQAVVIVEAIASALRAAEEHHVVHRDIKPDNIMFTKQGEVKLADLGIAKNDDKENELTKTNMMIGTPAYLPPEQAQNAKGVDGRADIYSLGATFYEMLTGQHPYPGSTTIEILHKLFSDPVPDPRKVNPEVSPASAAIVMKMLAKKPKDRFQNASELLETMDKAFPPHTAYEAGELIKKVIAGECQNSSTFSSSISSAHFFLWKFKKINKLVAAAVLLGILCCIAGVILLVSLLGRKSPSTAQETTPETNPSTVVTDVTPVHESKFDLQIKTTPDAEIHFITPSGHMSVYASDHEGMLKIPGLDPGNYKVRISRSNYRSISQDVELKDNMELDVPLVSDLKKLVIKAQPGSEIRITGIGNGEKNLKASEDGTAEFSDLLGETVFVHIELPGWETYDQTLLLNKDQELQAPQKRIMVSLTVRTVPNAEVVLKQNDGVVQSVKANSLGVAFADGIAAGEYRLSVSGDGYHSKEMTCDLSRNQNLSVDLQKITYVLTINAAAETQIMLFRDHQLQGTYLVPGTGTLRLSALSPGDYSVAAEKKGMVAQSFDLLLDQNKELDCHLAEAVATTVTGPAEQPDTSKPDEQQGGASSSEEIADTSTTNPPKEDNPPVVEKTPEGTVKVSLEASRDILDFIRENGVEIGIGEQTWSDVRDFPWSQTVEAGEYRISVRADGLKEELVQQFTVSADQENECKIEPKAIPSHLQFVSNMDDATITFNDSSYKPGDEVECETFDEITAVGSYGDEKITKTIRSTKPGDVLKLEFLFAEKVKEEEPQTTPEIEVTEETQPAKDPMQDQYEEGMKLFADRKYKDALKSFTPAAEAGHKEAIMKVAEINERGLGMWFSDSAEAIKWYKKASDLGVPEASAKVAKAIDKGDTKGTAKEMLDYYLKAVSLNDAEVFYRLSSLYQGYKEIPKDDAKALDYLRQAAELGLPDAMFDLGIRYEKGDGVVSNIPKALEWINKAADAGHDKAKRYSKQLRQ